jgi:hypothetical protein
MNTVIYLPNALCPQHRQVLQVAPSSAPHAPRATIASLAPTGWAHPFVAFVDGAPVLRAQWGQPLQADQALAFVDVHAIPQLGGGGGSDALRTVAMIALMVYAPGLGTALTGAQFGVLAGYSTALVTAGLTVGGMALINAVLPPPKPTSPQQATALAAASPTYSLQAQGNTARLEAAIPEHFGRMLAYPDYAAMPYAEYSGNEQYLYQLLCIGRGYYDIEAIRIEDTNIANFDDVTYEVIGPGQSVNLFPANVITSPEVGGQDLVDASYIGPFTVNPAGTTVNYVGLDFVMPRGLYYANNDGSLGEKNVQVQVELRRIDDVGDVLADWQVVTDGTQYGAWSDWSVYGQDVAMPLNTATAEYRSETSTSGDRGRQSESTTIVYVRTRTVTTGAVFTAASTTAQRLSLRFGVAAGRYECRVQRLDTKDTSTRAGHDAVWAGLRGYVNDARVYGDVTLLAVRMRASSQLSGQASRKINVIATRLLPTYTGSGWTGLQPTRSIAWALAYIAKSVGLTDAQIDLAALRTLDATWATRGDYFDARFDQFLSFWEAVSKTAQAGRAKVYLQGGVLRIARDQAATIPVAMFGMRNIVKNSFSVDYLMPTDDTADDVRVSYFDNVRWKPATVTAKLPASTSAKPSKIELFGVTNRAHAHREGLYTAASNRYRRKIIKFSTEMEGFIPSFLDLINIQHDMPGWGQGGEAVTVGTGQNLLRYSEDLSSNRWLGYFVKPAISYGHLAPDGSNTATKVISADSTGSVVGFSGFFQIIDAPVTGPITVSVWLRCETGTLGILLGQDDGVTVEMPVTTSWQKFSVTTPTFSNAHGDVRGIEFFERTPNNTAWYVWHPELVQGTNDVYIPTTTQPRTPTVLTLSEPLTFQAGSNHYISLRKRDGSVSGPYLATSAGVDGNQVAIDSAIDITPYTGGAQERTHFSFGWAETYRQRARVLSAKPLTLTTVAIECVNEDDNVHTADVGVTTPTQSSSQLAGFDNAPTVTGVSARPVSFNQARMLITWQPAAWATSYLVEQSFDGTSWTRVGTSSTASLECANLYGAATLVRVAAVSLYQGAWSQVAITIEAPPDVTGLVYNDGKLSWTALLSGNVSGYKLRFHYGTNLDWAVAQDLHTGLITESPYTMAVRPVGTVTIMVKAVETLLGLESAKVAYCIVNLGDALVANVLETVDYQALAWPGNYSNATVVGGVLQATQPDLFYNADESLFFALDGAAFYSGKASALEWISPGYTPSIAAANMQITAAWQLVGDSVAVEYRETGPGIFYGQDLSAFYGADTDYFYTGPSDWRIWPGSLKATGTELQWRVRTASGPTLGTLSAFAVSVDVPDINVRLNSVAVAATGTRLSGAVGKFIAIQNVQLTLQGGSTASYLEITDKSPSLGPLVFAKNASGVAVAATIDAFLQGY